MQNKIFIAKTPSGKPKIVDSNGFSIANAPDATKGSEEAFERLIISYNLLLGVSIEDLRNCVSEVGKEISEEYLLGKYYNEISINFLELK